MTLPRQTLSGSLVAPRRLGAALQSARAASGTPVAELSRHSGHWWLPDELLGVERGTVELRDAEILTLARLYGVRAAAAPGPDSAQLVIDRATVATTERSAAERSPGDGVARPELVGGRLAALASILHLDAEQVLHWASEIADIIGVATLTMRREIERRFNDRDSLAEASASLVDRIVVPSTGLLVAESADAAIVIGRRRDVPGGDGALVAGTLSSLAMLSGVGAS